MRIMVVGAGAIGGYLAARLAKAGRDVSIVARGAHLDAIRAQGLTLVTPEERFTVALEASDDPAALPLPDLVLLATKTTAHAELVPRLALGPETAVMLVQNGVFWWYGQRFDAAGRTIDTRRLDPKGIIAAGIGYERSLGMVVYSPNEVREPGIVHNNGFRNRFVVGEPDGSMSARLQAIMGQLGDCGFGIEATTDIRREMWKKLMGNLSSAPLCCLTRSRADQIIETAGMAALARAITEEGLAVAAAHGFTDLGVDPVAMTTPGNRPRHKPSMLQDLELGRPMEIDSLLLIVQDFARAAGIPTPTLDTCLALLVQAARTAGVFPPAG